MLKKSLLAAAVVLLTQIQVQAACVFPAEVEASAREWLQAGYSVGLIMATIDAKGQPCYLKLGTTQLKGQQAVDENTLFEIGSITKVFTALSLVRLQEQGKLKLSDKLQSLLPDVLVPKGSNREITLEDLASQVSGLPRLPDNLKPADINNPYADYSQGQLWSFLTAYKLPRPVGSEYEYSNLGVGLLGDALSYKTGQSYEKLVQSLVIQPLKLKDTGINLSPEQFKRFATGHAGQLAVPHWDFMALAGAGALRSSAADMVSFVSQAMAAQPSALSSSFQESFKVRHETGAPNLSIALGWHILGKDQQKQVYFHDGGTGGFLSFVGFNPASKQGVVALANSSTFPVNDLALHLLNPEHPLPKPRKEISLSSPELDRLVGNYNFSEIGLKAEIKREGDHLLAGFIGQGTVQLHAESPTRFFLTEVDALLEFMLDSQGQVIGLKLTQAGQTFEAKKE